MSDVARIVPSEAAPPPLSTAVAAKVASVTPGRTRRPWRELAIAAAISVIYPAYALHAFPLRRDLDALPPWWVALAGTLWASAYVWLLVRAIVPRRGDVLPNAPRAAGAATLAMAVLIAFGLAITIDAPCCTLVPATTWSDFAGGWWHCTLFGLRITAPLLLVGGLILRRVAWTGAGRLGMALGAAGGALAGLTLHLLCPIGGALHVGLAHGGGVVVGGLLGALVVRGRPGS